MGEVGGVAGLNIALEAREVLVENKVDHAGHGVRTPGRRGAAGYDIDPLDKGIRNGAQIHAAAQQVGRNHALAVEQDEGLFDAQIAQVECVESRVTLMGVVGPDTVVGRRRDTQRGKLPDRVADIGIGGGLQRFDPDRRDRRGLRVARNIDTRSRHCHRFEGTAGIVGLGLGARDRTHQR